MVQIEFANRAKQVLEPNKDVIGLAVGGSWLKNELDEYSDLDLILVTKQKVSHDKTLMLDYAKGLGNLLSGFTGEHVGEPRVLICLFDNPLLHVDLKFLTLEEFSSRIETPELLIDKDGQLKKIINSSQSKFPYPDYQWLEDRFWIWVHYALLKIGRGEYFEALDFISFLRKIVFGPLLHIKNNNLPRGVRKVEAELTVEDLNRLKLTIPNYNKKSLLNSLKESVLLYRSLRTLLFESNVQLQKETELRVMKYFNEVEKGKVVKKSIVK